MKVMILLIAIFSLFDDNENLMQAKQLIAIKKYTQAIDILLPIEDVRAQYYLGWCYLKMNRCATANTHFDRFIREYSGNNLWVEEAIKNKLNCSGPTYAVAQDSRSEKISKVKYDYKKINDDYQAAMATYQKKDTISEFNPVDLSSIAPITNFKRVRKASINNNDSNTTLGEKLNIKATNPDQTQKTPPAVNTKPLPDVASKSNSKPEEKTDITVAETKHHYKVLFSIENQPDKSFMSLANIGPVTYEKANGNNYMYYIGFFKTEEKAVDARDKVKAAGFQMARVMEFNKGQLEKEHISSDIQKLVEQEIVTAKIPEVPVKEEKENNQIPAPQIQEIIKSDVISYHILFRVLPDAYQKFDDLKHLGPLYRETYDAKGNSRYLIGNTDSKSEATKLLAAVKKAGYPASFIAEYINGQLSQIITE